MSKRPLDYFLLFFSNDMIDTICENTNTYAEIYRDKYPCSFKFFPTGGLNRIIFYTFLAIIVYMGLNPRDDYFSYWSTDLLFICPFIKSLQLSRNVFSAILTFLHVSNPDPSTVDKSDRLHKVRPLLTHVNENCQKHYHPSQRISADERMVKNKGRFTCKQYIRNKPVKWGFKLWVLCDSCNGYTYRFSVYRGKEGETVSSKGLSYDVIMQLVAGLEHQGYIVYMDNFYSSPTLFSDLLTSGFGAVGTLDTSRRGVPSSIAAQKKKMQKPCYDRGYGVWKRIGDLVYNIWKDTKVVCTLSSIHNGHSDHTVKRRKKKPEGGCEEVQVPIPNSIYDYNQQMGGVDLSDQLIQYFETRRRAHKYWKTLFFHCIDICVTNAYILYRESLPVEERNKCDHKTFVTELIKDLASYYNSSATSTTNPAHRPARSDVRAPHRLQYQETYGYCAACKMQKRPYNKTDKYCIACNVPLCFTHARDCFSEWHSPSFDGRRASSQN